MLNNKVSFAVQPLVLKIESERNFKNCYNNEGCSTDSALIPFHPILYHVNLSRFITGWEYTDVDIKRIVSHGYDGNGCCFSDRIYNRNNLWFCPKKKLDRQNRFENSDIRYLLCTCRCSNRMGYCTICLILCLTWMLSEDLWSRLIRFSLFLFICTGTLLSDPSIAWLKGKFWKTLLSQLQLRILVLRFMSWIFNTRE